MAVDRKTVDYVAGLARLRLDDEEKDALAHELGRVLAFVEQLDRVDVDGVPPTKHVIGLSNVERDDTPEPCLSSNEALANAPDADEGHFVVPNVLPD